MKAGGDVADFVQKNGAVVGQFEEADFPALFGTGESPFLMAEELAFQKCFRKGSAIDRHEGRFFAPADMMQGMGEKLLACTGFTANQNGGLRLAKFFRFGDKGPHARAFRNDIRHRVSGDKAFAVYALTQFPIDILNGAPFSQQTDSPADPAVDKNGKAVDDQLVILKFDNGVCFFRAGRQDVDQPQGIG